MVFLRYVQSFNCKDSYRCLYPTQKDESVAFSDHLVYLVKLSLPDPILKILSPKARPFFKTKPEIIRDQQFKVQLQVAMLKWQEVRQAGLQVLDWWELIVKPGIKRLAIIRSKEI